MVLIQTRLQLDADHSGVIDYTEFLAATLEFGSPAASKDGGSARSWVPWLEHPEEVMILADQLEVSSVMNEL